MKKMAGAAMAAGSLLLLDVALIIVVLIGAVRSDHNHGGLSPTSIDCGLPDGDSYTDKITNITYVSDSNFISTGFNYNISNRTASISIQETTLRSFPQGKRNCYTLPVQTDQKYLIRASFLHGNYDGQSVSDSNPVLFDLYLGVNLWRQLNISNASFTYGAEVISVPLGKEDMAICLVNKGLGTPFISSLEFRPLEESLYPHATLSAALVTYKRYNFGPADSKVIRYPDDPYDRIWQPFSNTSWTEISTTSPVQPRPGDVFEVPSAVLQTASASVNSTELLFRWAPPGGAGVRSLFRTYMHFAEVQSLAAGDSRQFDVYLNGDLYNRSFSPAYLLASSVDITDPNVPDQYNFLLNSTASSTRPPIINAVEVYSVLKLSEVSTDVADVEAIRQIIQQYEVKRNWVGDPCVPKEYTWDDLDCSYTSDAPRIKFLNLSSSGLNGTIDVSFGNLEALEYLDLSYNNLTGGIPAVLGKLPNLAFLNLTSNQLNGSIPSALLQKIQDGSLDLRIEGNPDLCTNGTSCTEKSTSTKKKLATPVIVIICVVAVILLLLVIIVIWKLRKPQGWRRGISAQLHSEDLSMQAKEHQDDSFQLENRQFTYMQLKNITNNFERVIGSGAYGTVYHGYLYDGTQVAVKMRSQTSSQGTKEFLAEAQLLTRVHHRNLVSMIGYCKDRDYEAVVYEYMSQGTLQEHLQGKAHNARTLSWLQRLCIAVDAAQGLEYLHKMCQPPLIHRDVKTGNILLSENLEAKIADFGLSKIFQSEGNSHIMTAVVGTPGYLDPEYYTTYQLSEKSDVYSFGVVLLELITGRPPILQGMESPHIVQWVRQGLTRGNIEDIVDPGLQQGDYNTNSVWKCADVAMECVLQAAHQRPTMADVVIQLKESLELETPFDGIETSSQTGAFAAGMSMVGLPPSAR